LLGRSSNSRAFLIYAKNMDKFTGKASLGQVAQVAEHYCMPYQVLDMLRLYKNQGTAQQQVLSAMAGSVKLRGRSSWIEP
jgi:hypothetical protein